MSSVRALPHGGLVYAAARQLGVAVARDDQMVLTPEESDGIIVAYNYIEPLDNPVNKEFLAKFRTATGHMVVGDPREKATRVGPLITPEHFSRVQGFVDRALKSGVTPLWGGHRDKAGELYFEPTLFDGVSQEMEIVQREVFGPVLTWQTFKDEAELIKLANGTQYGLAATLFCRSEDRAVRIAKQLVAGTVWVNCFFVRELAAPFGGSRDSGIGREGGNWSFDFFCDIKNIAVLKDSFA